MANFLRAPCENKGSNSCPAVSLKVNEKWILVATILGSSMAFIDGTIVNVALPAIQTALHTSLSQMQWVIESYALTLGALLLIGGSLGDLYGRRLVFLYGVVIFAIASAWCGFATSISQLIIARGIQGIGAALLVPGSLALISASFPEERRGKAIGTWAGYTSITTAAGPVVGGWLVQHLSWRLAFFINLPLAIIVLIVSILWVPESKHIQKETRLDIIGGLLAVIGLGGIVFGLIEWEHGGLLILGSEIIGVFALIAFLFVEAKSSFPMLPLFIFRSRNFSGANLITFFLYFSLYGVFFFLPLNLIQVQGYTATEAGAAFLPVILLLFLLSPWAGGLVKKFGARLPLVIGPAIAALGFSLYLRTGFDNPYWTSFFPASVVLGLGMAISVAPLTTVVMNSVDQDYIGSASGVNNAVSRIAGLLSIAILGMIMTMVFNIELSKKLKTSEISATTQQEIISQDALLADIKTTDARAQGIIYDSFLVGYEGVILIAVLLSLASSISAARIIEPVGWADKGSPT